MEPSIHSGDLVIIQRFSKVFNDIDKGDVVIAKSPSEYTRFILKRVKATDGQVVRRGINYQTVGFVQLTLNIKTLPSNYECNKILILNLISH